MLRILLYLLLSLVALPNLAQSSSEPYILLEDDRTFRFRGNEFDVYAVDISREMKVNIRSEEGVRAFSTFTLPEPIDPLARSIGNESIHPNFFLSIEKINSIKILVRRGGKVIRPTNMEPQMEAIQVATSGKDKYVTPWLYHYQLPPLQLGDELEIDYHYTVPLSAKKRGRPVSPDHPDSAFQFVARPGVNENFLGSFRIWFHGEVPKLRCKVRIEYPEHGPIHFGYPNDATPHTRFGKETIVEKWEYDRLPGILDEVGAHPYETLPYIKVNQQRPYQRLPELYRQREFDNDYLSIKVGSTSSQFRKLKRYVEAARMRCQDTTNFALAKCIHDEIALEFDYLDGSKEFRNENILELRFGDDLEANRLNETLKYDTYRNLVQAMGLDMATGFLCDKRSGVISSNYYFPKYRSDYCILPLHPNGSMLYLFPKFTPHGWLTDEMPFYYEGTRMQTVYTHYSDPDRNNRFVVGPRERKFIQTPDSDQKDNQRLISGKVTIHEEGIAVDFRISLSGQYSTLTRDLYLHDEPEPFIDPHYHEKWWHRLQVLNLQTTGRLTTTRFPYTATIDGSFDTPSIEGRLALNQWLPHRVVALDSLRYLDYYPDFVGDDKLVMLITSPAGYVPELPDPIDMRNEFGSYRLWVEKLDNGQIKLTSWLSITRKKVDASQVDQVREVYDAVQAAMASELSFSDQKE